MKSYDGKPRDYWRHGHDALFREFKKLAEDVAPIDWNDACFDGGVTADQLREHILGTVQDLEARADRVLAQARNDDAGFSHVTNQVRVFLNYAATCKTRNTAEWMEGFVARMNGLLKTVGDNDQVALEGDAIVIRKSNAAIFDAHERNST